MQTIGHFIDVGIYLAIGIYLIILSAKKKEKLGNKTALVKFAGIMMILLGILAIFK